ncbi:MAG: HDIG domain-containing protein [Candidatus Thermoplasmatota archaeon]|nr:HDIG domain-containing protein [Euryarchaeota archaeon]MBU4031205.1 HDIG domain-containing protein [Candidatus Thermoplasmatota archaeon]MBU4070611.1 HDIG domain-containing protein [Candidatus Thermoplasmatota archaeon]MBU4143438.1 HDIG domain-containing protein [Candidatus Thermoplasmatota archaeon]MBU4592628.1 HDIG domain-containing protein [Candidatus Thermoplasmatota archaeon]
MSEASACAGPIPSVEMCLSFLAEENVPNKIIDHCMAVEHLALKIAMRITKDKETLALISRGALLHDIGRSKDHGISHAVIGADILRKRGLDGRIILIVERHISAGIDAAEAEETGLPVRDYIPLTLAEKIVAHADTLITEKNRAPARWSVRDAIARERGKGFESSALKIEKLHAELSQLAGIDLDEII